jgi:hypothetical protein
MSFVVSCQCGKQFRVADEQMGKKSRCKGCGAVLHLVPDGAGAAPPPPPPPPPPPADPFAQEDDPFASVDWNAADAQPTAPPPPMPARSSGGGAPPPMPTPVAAGGPKQKACPSCGAIISAFALRCEHCGANLTGGTPVAAPGKPQKLAYAAGGDDDSELTAVDWILCIVCSGIGCILGIVYLIQGKPKGGKMIGISLLVGFISGAVRQYLKQRAGAP